MTTESGRPDAVAQALAALVLITVTLGGATSATLAFAVDAPWWVLTAPLWAPFAAAYAAVLVALVVRLAVAITQPRSRA